MLAKDIINVYEQLHIYQNVIMLNFNLFLFPTIIHRRMKIHLMEAAFCFDGALEFGAILGERTHCPGHAPKPGNH